MPSQPESATNVAVQPGLLEALSKDYGFLTFLKAASVENGMAVTFSFAGHRKTVTFLAGTDISAAIATLRADLLKDYGPGPGSDKSAAGYAARSIARWAAASPAGKVWLGI